MIKNYETFVKVDKEYSPAPGITMHGRLPAGMFRVDWDPRMDTVTFVELESNHDKLVDLPGTEYDLVVKDMDTFLSDECMARFKEMDYLHKMNILLHGAPGTGKTCIVNRVAQKIIEHDGIVLFNPVPAALKTTYNVLDSIQPETRVLVIFEEMDDHVRNHEAALLHVLDGEIQKKNAMYIATTNYIDRIPHRVRRPGRFPSVIEVGFPSTEARCAYLKTKLKDQGLVDMIVSKTEGFSIDELREVIRGHYCMGKPLNKYIEYVKECSANAKGDEPSIDEDDDCEDKEDMIEDLGAALRQFVGKQRRKK